MRRRPSASAVKITKADGTVDFRPAYDSRTRARIAHVADAFQPRPATKPGTCRACGGPIEIGQQIVWDGAIRRARSWSHANHGP